MIIVGNFRFGLRSLGALTLNVVWVGLCTTAVALASSPGFAQPMASSQSANDAIVKWDRERRNRWARTVTSGTPKNSQYLDETSSANDIVLLAEDVQEVAAAERESDSGSVPPTRMTKVVSDLSASTVGQWFEQSNGLLAYRLSAQIEGVESIAFSVRVPRAISESFFTVYSAGEIQDFGRSAAIERIQPLRIGGSDRQTRTEDVSGNQVILELRNIPVDHKFSEGEDFIIGVLAQGGVIEQGDEWLWRGLECEHDYVRCDADAYRNAPTVARFVINGRACTGSLLADNEASTRIPYLLTAAHCLGSNPVAGQVYDIIVTIYSFSTSCSLSNMSTSRDTFVGAARLLASEGCDGCGGPPDWALLSVQELQKANPAPGFLSLSQSAPGVGTDVVTPHHPDYTKWMRESTGDVALLDFPGGANLSIDLNFSNYLEPGSSGSPWIERASDELVGITSEAVYDPFCSSTINVLTTASAYVAGRIEAFLDPVLARPFIRSFTAPAVATIGEPFRVRVEAENLGQWTSGDGHIHIELLDLLNSSDVSVVGSSGDLQPLFIENGELIWDRFDARVNATNLHFEAYETNWLQGERNFVELEITPREAGQLRIGYRAAMRSENQIYYNAPVDDSAEIFSNDQAWGLYYHQVSVEEANSAPNTPSNPSPSNSAINVNISTNLSWSGGDPDGDPVTYDVYLEADDSTPNDVVCNDTSSTTCDPGSNLSPGQTYYWYVEARDSGGLTRRSDTWEFTTSSANNAPNEPSNPSPSDFATNVSVGTSLSWAGGDPDGDSVTYDVFLEAGDSTPNDIVCNDTSSTTCNPSSDLIAGQTYYWKVTAMDSGGLTRTSDTWQFTTSSANNAPNEPSNPSPSDFSANVSVGTSLSWTGGDPDGDPVEYDVFLEAVDATPSNPICVDISTTTCNPSGDLNAGQTYYWKVTAIDSGGLSRSSPVWQFTTEASEVHTLAVSSNSISGVLIDASPNAFAGTTDYSISGIASGTTISLTAPSSSDGQGFNSWSGCDSISGSDNLTCTITMNSDKAVDVAYQSDSGEIIFVNSFESTNSITRPLNDTGIDWCADAETNNMACPVVGFDGQDGEFGRDALARSGQLNKVGSGAAGFDFTKLDANGKDLPVGASSWSCVRDNHTALIWETKTDDGGLRDKENTYTWYNPDSNTNGGDPGVQDGGSCVGSSCDATGFAQAVNAQGLCGASDWRLPSINQLFSIVLLGVGTPAVDIEFFPTVGTSRFWSATTDPASLDRAFYLFAEGEDSTWRKSSSYGVRLVSGGQ